MKSIKKFYMNILIHLTIFFIFVSLELMKIMYNNAVITIKSIIVWTT